MSINFKLINFMLTNFVNKQISYFFSLRCFLDLIKFIPINFKLINLMLMNFVNKQISSFFPPRCFLVLMKFYRKKVNFFHLNVFNVFQCFLVLFGAFLVLFRVFQCFFVLAKSYRKKKLNQSNNLIYTTTQIFVKLLQIIYRLISNYQKLNYRR